MRKCYALVCGLVYSKEKKGLYIGLVLELVQKGKAQNGNILLFNCLDKLVYLRMVVFAIN